MTGIVEEADRVRPSRLYSTRIGVDGLVKRGQPSVANRCHLEAEARQCLLKQCNVIVRVGEPADLAAVSFIADQKRHALLGERGRVDQNKTKEENYRTKHHSIPHPTRSYARVL